MTRNGKGLDRAAGRRLGNVDCGLLEASLYLQVLHGFTGVVRRGVTGRVLALQKEYFLAEYPALAVKLGALKNQPQHLGGVKVLGWKKQKSCISS